MTVLLVGSDQRELDLLADAVAERGGDPHRIDLTEWPGATPIAVEPGATAAVAGSRIDLTDVTGAFVFPNDLFRPIDPRFKDDLEADLLPALSQLREYRGLFQSFCRLLERRGADVIVPLDDHYWQDWKPWQLAAFEDADVAIPDTVFTNDPDRVRRFYENHDRVVYKPVTKGGLARELTESDLDERLDKLATAPVQFQAFVPGDDVRAFVLDGELVGAARYDSEHFSFKQDLEAGREIGFEPVSLPQAVEAAVVRATDRSGLVYAGADLRLQPDGSYALLELNEAAAFAAADVKADLDVAGALGAYLCYNAGHK